MSLYYIAHWFDPLKHPSKRMAYLGEDGWVDDKSKAKSFCAKDPPYEILLKDTNEKARREGPYWFTEDSRIPKLYLVRIAEYKGQSE